MTTYHEVKQHHEIIDSNLMLDYYRRDFMSEFFTPDIHLITEVIIEKPLPSDINNCHFMDYLRSKWLNYSWFFIDGSVHTNPRSVSFGIFSPNNDFKFSASLCKYASIVSAELIAIYVCILYIMASKNTQNVIFSDSKSALMAIKSWHLNRHNYLVQRIIDKLLLAFNKSIKIHICWIPSHSGINYNES